jgi:hypothetical protein
MDDHQIHIEMVLVFLDKRGTRKYRKNKSIHGGFYLPDGGNTEYFSDDDSFRYDQRRGHQAQGRNPARDVGQPVNYSGEYVT